MSTAVQVIATYTCACSQAKWWVDLTVPSVVARIAMEVTDHLKTHNPGLSVKLTISINGHQVY